MTLSFNNFSAKPHKYNAKRCEYNGISFHSQLERDYYVNLLLLQNSGQLIYFLRQVPLHLPGKVKYVVDFVEFWSDGWVYYVDVKGYDTPLSKTKRKMVEDLYPIKIKVVNKVKKLYS